MIRLEQLELDIRELGPEDFSALRDWLLEYDAERWDRQIEEDALSGKLDTLAGKAIAAHRAGMTRPL